MRAGLILCLSVTVAVSAACSRERASSSEPAPASPPPASAAAPRPEDSSRPKIVVLGDSLTAGLGLAQSDAYPALVEQKVRAAGYDWDVVNAGVSGDTSAAGL